MAVKTSCASTHPVSTREMPSPPPSFLPPGDGWMSRRTTTPPPPPPSPPHPGCPLYSLLGIILQSPYWAGFDLRLFRRRRPRVPGIQSDGTIRHKGKKHRACPWRQGEDGEEGGAEAEQIGLLSRSPIRPISPERTWGFLISSAPSWPSLHASDPGRALVPSGR